jgi:hypothetical protein
MTNFAVLRIAKITSLKGLAGAAAHNNRTATVGLDHADSRAPLMGGGIQLLAGRNDAVAAWRERVNTVGLGKPRKDAVRALEAVISASPEWFAQASYDDRIAWRDQSMAWAARTFGDENILSAHSHDDEGNPHLQILAIPLTQKKRKKVGRPRKGRQALPRAAVNSWGLSAADLIGSPEKLTLLQTSYAADVANLGIRRGYPRRVTGARHRSAAAYRAEAAELLDATHDDRIRAMDELASVKGARMFAEIDAEQSTATAKQSAAETAMAFTIGLDAIDAGELVYCAASDKRSARLKRAKVEIPCLPIDRSAFQSWCRTVQPLFARLLGYARRLNRVSTLEHKVVQRASDLAIEAAAIHRVLQHNATEEVVADNAGCPTKRDGTTSARDWSMRSAKEATR